MRFFPRLLPGRLERSITLRTYRDFPAIFVGAILIFLVLPIVLAGPAAATGAGPLNVVMIIFDGARTSALEKLVDAGHMPNITKILEEGAWVKNGTTVLPSTTGPSYAPFVMGLFPKKSLIPGIRWYDRETGRYRVYCGTDASKANNDLTVDFPTIYELLPAHHTLSVFGFIDRGCKKTTIPLIKSLMAKLQKDNDKLDNNLFASFEKEVRNKFPRFAFLSIHGVDGYGHSDGAESDKYYESLKNYDAILGKMLDLYRELGHLDDTVFVISSDHGQRPVSIGEGLKDLLSSKNIRVRDSVPRSTIAYNMRKDHNARSADCILAVSGNACVQLYFKDHGLAFDEKKDMRSRPGYSQLRRYPVGSFEDGRFIAKGNVDVVEELLTHPAVGLVLVRDGYKYHVFGKEGHGVITRNGPRFGYSITEGEDPLGFASTPAAALMDEGTHNGDNWLKATCRTEYPDGIVQFVQFLETPGAGDIIFFSAPDYEPWNEGQKGVHGGPRRDEMVVPIIFWGPGIKSTEILCARTVDIFPTIARALGVAIPEEIDGKVLPVFDEDYQLPRPDPGPLAAFAKVREKLMTDRPVEPLGKAGDALESGENAAKSIGSAIGQAAKKVKSTATAVEDKLKKFIFGN